MARIDVTEADVLEALLRRLQGQLDLPDDSCILSTHPLGGELPVGGEFWVVVSPGGGVFDESLQIGGGAEQCHEDLAVAVTIFSRVRLDRSGHDRSLLLDLQRGLAPLKRKVLRALVGHDLLLTDDPASTFLRQLIAALSSDAAAYDEEKLVGWQTLRFRVGWDWDLSADGEDE